MSLWGDLDPSGHNFLGLGDKIGRWLGSSVMPNAELLRKDPFGMGPNTIGAKVGHGIEGGAQGAIGGFVTGGWPGAIVGGVTGGVRSGLGDSDPTSIAGRGGGAAGNFGVGATEGVGAGYYAGSGLFSGAAGGSGGASAMTPYMPTSTPVMSQAGSTLGGGMSSPLNLGGPSMGAAPTAAGPSAVSQALNMMRGMPSSGQQQTSPAAQQASKLQMLYKMFPSLKPGAQFSNGGNTMGGM